MPTKSSTARSDSTCPKETQPAKLGTFFGVYLPGVISMFSVVLFLRLGWIVGYAGLYKTLLIVTLAFTISFITSLSIASSSTNMKVKQGGTYYMISRAFGIEIGAAIGLPLFFSQAIMASFSLLGFVVSLKQFFPNLSIIAVSGAILVLITLISTFASGVAFRSQLLIFCILLLSMASFFYGIKDYAPLEKVNDLFVPQSFWSLFALFFPAATGIELGASMSGSLKNPRRSLVYGTIGMIVTGYIIYIAYALALWNTVPNEILRTDPLIVEHVARYGKLVIAGLWFGTLSCSLSYLLAAPRSLQALAIDSIVPKFIGRCIGPNQEPVIAIILSFCVSLVAVTVGKINILATALSMILLITYGMLNLAAGLEELMGNPSWRPTFYIPFSVSIFGFVLCLIAMLMIDPGWAILSIALVIIAYFVTKKRGLNSGFDDLRQSLMFYLTRSLVYKLEAHSLGARAWRPKVLVFSRVPKGDAPTKLLRFANELTYKQGFLTTACILTKDTTHSFKRVYFAKLIREKLRKIGLSSLVEVQLAENPLQGMKEVICNYGLGALVPNTVLFGQWTGVGASIHAFIDVIREALGAQKNVILFREGKTSSEFIATPRDKATRGKTKSMMIDIWWDDRRKDHSELMLILAHMLQKCRYWRHSRITLKSAASSVEIKWQKESFFKEFKQKTRFNFETEVFLYDAAIEDVYPVIQRNSTREGILFLALRAPFEGESTESYTDYYEKLQQTASECETAAFVISQEKNHLHELFEN